MKEFLLMTSILLSILTPTQLLSLLKRLIAPPGGHLLLPLVTLKHLIKASLLYTLKYSHSSNGNVCVCVMESGGAALGLLRRADIY